jgi:hypothetical protein
MSSEDRVDVDEAERERLRRVEAMRGVEEIEKQIAATEGARLFETFAPVRALHRIFLGNAQELHEMFVLNASDEFAHHLWDVRNRALLDGFLDETGRRVYNYVASAMSLVEQTRTAIRAIYAEETDARIEYETRVRREFVESGESQFVQDLRDLMLHVEASPVNARFTLTREKPGADLTARRELHLYRPRLRRWQRWSASARDFLEGLGGDEVLLEPLIRDYTSRVRRFYDWLAKWHAQQHPAAYQELNELQAKLKKTIIEGGLADPGDPTTRRRTLAEIMEAIRESKRVGRPTA